jgi:hypothetical protein
MNGSPGLRSPTPPWCPLKSCHGLFYARRALARTASRKAPSAQRGAPQPSTSAPRSALSLFMGGRKNLSNIWRIDLTSRARSSTIRLGCLCSQVIESLHPKPKNRAARPGRQRGCRPIQRSWLCGQPLLSASLVNFACIRGQGRPPDPPRLIRLRPERIAL